MTPRDAILSATAALLETQGYYGTGLNQIIAESGAPKGSLYHYFPDGKEGLTAAVIAITAAENTARIRQSLARHADPAAAIHGLLTEIAGYIAASGCRGGGPITTVALETAAQSERLRLACDAAYSAWQMAFAEKLMEGGYPAQQSAALATVIVAATEGAIVLCRTAASPEPMHIVAHQISMLVRATLPQA